MTNPTTTPMLETINALTIEAAPEAPFATAARAWLWATEVLRRRRLPPTSPAWRDDIAITAHQRAVMLHELTRINLAAEATQVADVWGRRFDTQHNPNLPQGSAERYALAQRIQAAVLALPNEDAKLLQLWAWGDWADDARLRHALHHQELARRQGLRVRLCYRYSAAQLASLMGCSKAQAWRRVRAALIMLSKHLQGLGIVKTVAHHAAQTSTESIPSPKKVAHAQFKPRAT